MKIIPNIPGAIKLFTTLKYLAPFKREIEDAKAKGDYERERLNIQKAEDAWANNVMAIFGSNLTVHGKENLPKEGPVVFIGNHQGYADIIAYCAALGSIAFGFIAKDDLGKIPIYGKWILRIRSIFIHRDNPRSALTAIEEGIALIEKGFSFMIFPEGTRSKGGEVAEFKRGAFKLATKPGVPIIPVSINGSYRMFEETGVFKGAKIDVIVHPAIETKGLDRAAEKQLTQDVEHIVKSGVLELQKEDDPLD